VALTFFGGPWPSTPALRDMLIGMGAKATFFIAGQKIDNNPTNIAQLQLLVSNGFELGGYPYSGEALNGKSSAQVRSEYIRTSDAMYKAVNIRPRYGKIPGDATAQTNAEWRSTILSKPVCVDRIIGYNVDSRDYVYQGTNDAAGEATLLKNFLASQETNPNGKSIITLGSDQQSINVDAIREFIVAARASPYNKRFVTMTECLGDQSFILNAGTPGSPVCDTGTNSAAFGSAVPSVLLVASLAIFSAVAFWN